MVSTRKLLAILLLAGAASQANAELRNKTIDYQHGDTALQGYLAWDDQFKDKRPGVLVVHEWWGHNQFVRQRADALAKLGYVAFAVDMYGKGIQTKDPSKAGQLAGKFKQNRQLARDRMAESLKVLRQQPQVNASKIGAIGFCFGGTCVLELARSGADVSGVVSFHGDLAAENAADAKNIHCKVLALHGADDPFVPAKVVAEFEAEMRDAKVDWQLIKYGNAVHSFTNRDAGNDNSKGAAYNANAEKRSWEAMRDFFQEAFGKEASPSTSRKSQKQSSNDSAMVVKKAASAVPDKVLKVLEYVDSNKRAPDGYEGGRHFGNFEKRLASKSTKGANIRYQEWDVNPLRTGVNRGAERLITGSDGSAYFTNDHYETFKRIR